MTDNRYKFVPCELCHRKPADFDLCKACIRQTDLIVQLRELDDNKALHDLAKDLQKKASEHGMFVPPIPMVVWGDQKQLFVAEIEKESAYLTRYDDSGKTIGVMPIPRSILKTFHELIPEEVQK